MSRSKESTLSVSLDDWASWSQELQAETDRGLATASSAILENLLGRLIEGFLVDDTRASEKLLSDAYSPLSSFSARIAAAYSLGLISKDERDDLNLIREIRNVFTHQTNSPSFSDDRIEAKVQRLKTYKLITKEIVSSTSAPPKEIFREVVTMLSTFIDLRTHMEIERRVTPKKFVFRFYKP